MSKLPAFQRLISDSLMLGQGGITQAKQDVKHLIVLGVDFMNKNVRALLHNMQTLFTNMSKLPEEAIKKNPSGVQPDQNPRIIEEIPLF